MEKVEKLLYNKYIIQGEVFMLGYVKPEPAEMLVKHHSLYRAIYCGLCHSVKRNTTSMALPFFSDDFVFLAALRMAVSGEEIHTEKDFCILHPFRKDHKRIADCEAMRYAAVTSLIFTCEKMQDELLDKDAPMFRRLVIRLWLPFLKRALGRNCKKEERFQLLHQKIAALLSQGRELERKNAELDTMCSNFAQCLSLAFSFGIDGEQGRLLHSIGDRIGRFLYTLDALDDLEKDEKSGAFNPILGRYSSAKAAKDQFSQLDLVLSFYVQEAMLAFDLLIGEKNLLSVCENILCHGLPGASGRILKPKMGEENERSL